MDNIRGQYLDRPRLTAYLQSPNWPPPLVCSIRRYLSDVFRMWSCRSHSIISKVWIGYPMPFHYLPLSFLTHHRAIPLTHPQTFLQRLQRMDDCSRNLSNTETLAPTPVTLCPNIAMQNLPFTPPQRHVETTLTYVTWKVHVTPKLLLCTSLWTKTLPTKPFYPIWSNLTLSA